MAVDARARAGSEDDAPLVLTLALDDASAQRLTALRRQHFPARRNHLDAHVTLFHAVPGRVLAEVVEVVAAVAPPSAFDVDVAAVTSLGRGTALRLRSPDADALRAALLRELAGTLAARGLELTRQDARPSALHVTVANKLDPSDARALTALLSTGFVPWTARAAGVDVWRYRGGPWDHAARVPFGR